MTVSDRPWKIVRQRARITKNCSNIYDIDCGQLSVSKI